MHRNARRDDRVFRLPAAFQDRARALDPAVPAGPIFVHVTALPPNIAGFASNGRIWIAADAFRPDTGAGQRLIGHELAHLARQRGTGLDRAPFPVDDPDQEAAADRFGAAFAAASLIGAAWTAAQDAAAPRGPVQFSATYGKPQHTMNLGNQVFHDDFGDVEEDDEADEDEDEDGPQGPGGSRAVTSSVGGTARSVVNPSRAVVGAGVGITNQVSGVLGGTGVLGHFTGALSAGAGAAMAPAAAVLGPAGIALMLLDIGLSAKSAASTYAHICALEAILEIYKGRPGVRASTLEAIAYTLNKKNKKLKRKGFGCIPILGSICNTVYTAGRTIQKRVQGTRGIERRAMAKTLWQNMLAGDPAAIAACEDLLGVKTFTKIRIYIDGDVVLKKKMKSL